MINSLTSGILRDDLSISLCASSIKSLSRVRYFTRIQGRECCLAIAQHVCTPPLEDCLTLTIPRWPSQDPPTKVKIQFGVLVDKVSNPGYKEERWTKKH